MKKINTKYLIVFALILPLITQMFNTANLYQSISNLFGWEKTLASYFVGVSFEISIFVCILSGSRAAGAWFAILSFFVGIMFHDSWDYFLIDFQNVIKDPVHISYHKKFYATTLLQFINSVLVWFLSELYVSKQKATKLIKDITHLEQSYTETEQKLSDSEKRLTELNTTIKTSTKLVADLEQREENLQQEITALQKRKAGMSKGIALDS